MAAPAPARRPPPPPPPPPAESALPPAAPRPQAPVPPPPPPGLPEPAFVPPALPGHYARGDAIGDSYRVEKVLGEGGFGIVYLVQARRGGGRVAVKTIRDEWLRDDATRAMFRKEAELWIALGRHPYLVRADFVDEEHGRLFLVMEYIAPDARGMSGLAGSSRARPSRPRPGLALRRAVLPRHGVRVSAGHSLPSRHQAGQHPHRRRRWRPHHRLRHRGSGGPRGRGAPRRPRRRDGRHGRGRGVRHPHPHAPRAVRGRGELRRAERHLQLRRRPLSDGGPGRPALPPPGRPRPRRGSSLLRRDAPPARNGRAFAPRFASHARDRAVPAEGSRPPLPGLRRLARRPRAPPARPDGGGGDGTPGRKDGGRGPLPAGNQHGQPGPPPGGPGLLRRGPGPEPRRAQPPQQPGQRPFQPRPARRGARWRSHARSTSGPGTTAPSPIAPSHTLVPAASPKRSAIATLPSP